MPTPRGAYLWLDLSLKEDDKSWVDADVAEVGACIPVAGTIKEVWVGCIAQPTTGTIALAIPASGAATSRNVLSAASYDLTTGADAVCASVTLASGSNCVVAAGEMIKATWTLTDITVGTTDGLSCLVGIEPDIW